MANIWIQKSFAPLKRILPRSVWQPIRAIVTALITPVRFSARTGHWKSSLCLAAVSARGAPIPWYTYSAVDFLARRSFDGRNILEFGGGQSTLWWSERASSVLTIEEDSQWYEKLRSKIGANVTLHLVPAVDAVRSMARIREVISANPVSKFDVIIVDGHLRRMCTALAFDYLAPDGGIILDNAEGYGFYEETRERSCRRIDFFGFAPGVSLRHCTSLVFVGDCFMLRPDIKVPHIEYLPD